MSRADQPASRNRRITVATAILLALLGAMGMRAGVARAVTNPVTGPYPQVHGEQVTGIPATSSCTTTIVQDYRFHNTAYGSDPPFSGNYVPTCAGPWSKVVLTMSARVATGTQFDRIGDVLIGGVELLHLTTPEGESGTTTWSIQRDVTADASMLGTEQPTYFIIGNQTDGTYTGDFYGTLSLTFYSVGDGAPAAAFPDKVIGLNQPLAAGLPTRSGDRPLSTAVTIPANTTALTAEVFTSGHGSEEEDWWNAPFVCASGGIPYREVGVSVDGQLAGVAPVYPTIYTGGYGPDFWRPLPSPRAYNLRPYLFDLAPWIGHLTDGTAHTISLAVIGQGGCSGYWFLGGNLLVTVNPLSTGRTLGGVTAYSGDPVPTSTTLAAQGTTASDRTTSAHHLDITGTLHPAGVATPTTVHLVQDMTNAALDAALDVQASWTWDSGRSDITGAHTEGHSQRSTYSLERDGPHWNLTDNQTTSTTLDGTTTGTTRLTDSMQTAGPVLGVTGIVGASQESWTYAAADGSCTDHELVSAAQNVVSDTSTACGAAAAAALPETSSAVALLISALFVAGFLARRRRSLRPHVG